MSNKTINVEQIESTDAKVKDLLIEGDATLSQEPQDWMEDDSFDIFKGTHSSMKEAASHMTEAAVNLNDYLNKVAETFEAADKALQEKIGSGVFRGETTQERYVKSKNEDMARSLTKEMP